MPSRISVADEHLVAHHIDAERVEAINVLWTTIQFLTSPDEKGAPCVMRGTIPPGVSIPLHSHADPVTFMAIHGLVEGLIFKGEEFKWVRIGPGDIFHVPAHAKHGFRNQGRYSVVMLVISTSTLGKFFQEVGRRTGSGTSTAPPSREEVARFLKVSERYGYWNATPEENARVGIAVPLGTPS